MSATILIIDDEYAIQQLLDVALCAAGYRPLAAYSAQEGMDKLLKYAPDLILLDLNLPDQDGIDFLDTLRRLSTLPLIVLSARHHEQTKITLLEHGADDYVTKPFGTGELLARIHASLRRCDPKEPIRSSYISGNLRVDIPSHSVYLEGALIHTTPKEFDLLILFLIHQGKVLTYNYLLKEVWGVGYQNEVHYLRIFVKQLRYKIEPNPSRPIRLRTETSIGYRFVE